MKNYKYPGGEIEWLPLSVEIAKEERRREFWRWVRIVLFATVLAGIVAISL